MASTSVPDVLINLAAQLRLRPAVIGPPKVAVHEMDLGTWDEDEAIVLGKVTVADADFFAQGTYATAEPPALTGYLFVEQPGSDDAAVRAVLLRGKVLIVEVMQQLRDDASVGGALAPPTMRRPPRVSSQTWQAVPADTDGAGVVRLRVDFTIQWTART